MTRLKKVFDSKKDKLNTTASTLDTNDSKTTLSSAFSMLGDAVEKESSVYKMDKPIKSKKKIPSFIFL